jgi:hypothetical protein
MCDSKIFFNKSFTKIEKDYIVTDYLIIIWSLIKKYFRGTIQGMVVQTHGRASVPCPTKPLYI